MASILDRYGIKEVADFTFYTIDSTTGKPSAPALYLDTLKVSTVEQNAELVEAKGGKGNVTLLSWDINKELNVTLEDALFSAKSLAIMFGNGTLKSYTGESAYIMRTEVFVASGTTVPTQGTQGTVVTTSGWTNHYEGPDGKLYLKRNPKFYTAAGEFVNTSASPAMTFVSGDSYFCSYDITVSGSVIDVSAYSFPGTYYCVGDTYVRNAKSGKDEFFQIIIPKAKVQSQNTLTMQAEGDPSTFNMSLKVMKPDDGVMIKLVKKDGKLASAYEATVDVK